MSDTTFYSSPEWRELRERVLERDDHVCVLRRFIGTPCSGPLHVHHVRPRAERPDLELDPENLVTGCERHHPTLEALRRLLDLLDGDGELPPCRHEHRYREGRLACERRRRRALAERRASRLLRTAA